MLKQRGFTLLELLVVMAIIIVVFSVFIGVLSGIQQKSLSRNCQLNLRLLSNSLYLYAKEFGGYLPHSDRDSDKGYNYCWFDVIDPFLGTDNLTHIKQCPSWDGYQTFSETVDAHSIKMNGGLSSKEHPQESLEDIWSGHWYWPRLWQIRQPQKTVLLLDGTLQHPWNHHTGTRRSKPFRDIANRHSNGSNLLMVDGSCVWREAQQVILSETDGWDSDGGYIWELPLAK